MMPVAAITAFLPTADRYRSGNQAMSCLVERSRRGQERSRRGPGSHIPCPRRRRRRRTRERGVLLAGDTGAVVATVAAWVAGATGCAGAAAGCPGPVAARGG